MAPRLHLLTLLLSAPLALSYLTGEDVTLCWVSRNGTRELLSSCGADFVEFVTTLPTTLDATRRSQVARAAELKAMLEEAPAPAPPQRELGELEA